MFEVYKTLAPHFNINQSYIELDFTFFLQFKAIVTRLLLVEPKERMKLEDARKEIIKLQKFKHNFLFLKPLIQNGDNPFIKNTDETSQKSLKLMDEIRSTRLFTTANTGDGKKLTQRSTNLCVSFSAMQLLTNALTNFLKSQTQPTEIIPQTQSKKIIPHYERDLMAEKSKSISDPQSSEKPQLENVGIDNITMASSRERSNQDNCTFKRLKESLLEYPINLHSLKTRQEQRNTQRDEHMNFQGVHKVRKSHQSKISKKTRIFKSIKSSHSEPRTEDILEISSSFDSTASPNIEKNTFKELETMILTSDFERELILICCTVISPKSLHGLNHCHLDDDYQIAAQEQNIRK